MADPNIIEALNEIGLKIDDVKWCLYVITFAIGGIVAMLIFWKK